LVVPRLPSSGTFDGVWKYISAIASFWPYSSYERMMMQAHCENELAV
jgi:hypothetical protein